jgi:putative ABC transport system permease protein
MSRVCEVSRLSALTRAFRNISRRKIRALLVIIALGFSMAIMISVPSGIVANQESTQRLTTDYNRTISNYQAQINQTLTLIECSNTSGSSFESFPGSMRGFGSRADQSFLDESIISTIASISGVQAAVPILEKSEGTMQNATYFERTFPRFLAEYTIEGVTLNSSLINNYSILPTNITEGRNLRAGESGVVLLSLNNTQFFGVGVGGTVNILGSDFAVVGVHGSTGFGQTITLYMNLSDAQRITNSTGKISRLDVYGENSSVTDSIATEIKTLYSISATTYGDRLSALQQTETNLNDMLTRAESTVSQEQTVASQEIVVAIVATSLIVLFVMLYTVRERTREIGTLKAIGFSNWNVMSQFMLEGVLLSIVAGIVGIGIGIVAAPTLSGLLLPLNIGNPSGSSRRFQPNPSGAMPGMLGVQVAAAVPSPQLLLLALGGAVLLGALGSLYPAWRASRTRPAEAMRYE